MRISDWSSDVCSSDLDVTVAERVLGDRFAVDLRAVGRIEIFEERVLENGDDGGVATGHGLVIERDVVVRMPADADAFLGQREIPHPTIAVIDDELAHNFLQNHSIRRSYLRRPREIGRAS